MKNITVDFKEIVTLLRKNKLNICFLRSKWILIEDEQKNLYQMENLQVGSCLDKLIKNAVVVTFNLVSPLISQGIREWEKEIWDCMEVEKFIQRHSLL